MKKIFVLLVVSAMMFPTRVLALETEDTTSDAQTTEQVTNEVAENQAVKNENQTVKTEESQETNANEKTKKQETTTAKEKTVVSKNEEETITTQSDANARTVDNAPVIGKPTIVNTDGKYKITVQVTATDGLDKVLFPTWTEKNGQDDLLWGQGTISGNKVTYTVDFKNHNYETGKYITHIYAYDKFGKYTVMVLPTQTIKNDAPKIENLTVNNEGAKYTITAKVTDDYALDRVMFASWTEKNGQDDLVWGKGTISGDTVTYTVSFKDHKLEEGKYVTHIYAYDKAGKYKVKVVPTQTVKNRAPKINTPTVKKTGGKYKITLKVTDDYALDRVMFASWTEKNGQDDLVWGKGTIQGSTVTYTVDFKNHHYETGKYITHVYAYDKLGKQSMIVLPVQNVQNAKPTIGKYQISSSAGKYKIS